MLNLPAVFSTCLFALFTGSLADAEPQYKEHLPPERRSSHSLWLESGLSLGVNVLNDLPDVVFDAKGRRAGIVSRNRAAFELAWLPRVAYSFHSGVMLGLYGGLGFTGPSTPQMAIMLDANGVTFERNRDKETGYALSVMGGTFVGLRRPLSSWGYVLPTVGIHWRGRQQEVLRSKLMVDLRVDTGFRVGRSTFLAIGPDVRLAAFSWGGLSHAALKDISFNLVMTVSHALL